MHAAQRTSTHTKQTQHTRNPHTRHTWCLEVAVPDDLCCNRFPPSEVDEHLVHPHPEMVMLSLLLDKYLPRSMILDCKSSPQSTPHTNSPSSFMPTDHTVLPYLPSGPTFFKPFCQLDAGWLAQRQDNLTVIRECRQCCLLPTVWRSCQPMMPAQNKSTVQTRTLDLQVLAHNLSELPSESQGSLAHNQGTLARPDLPSQSRLIYRIPKQFGSIL